MGTKGSHVAEKPQPWERQPGEGAAAFRHFRSYLVSRDLDPPRDLRVLAPQLGLSYDTIRKYSSRGDWARRAAAWDDRVAAAEDAEVIADAATRRREHLEALAKARRLALTKVDQLLEGGDEVEARDAFKLLLDVVKLERSIDGAADARIELRSSEVDLDQLSASEIRTLRELKRKAARDAS